MLTIGFQLSRAAEGIATLRKKSSALQNSSGFNWAEMRKALQRHPRLDIAFDFPTGFNWAEIRKALQHIILLHGKRRLPVLFQLGRDAEGFATTVVRGFLYDNLVENLFQLGRDAEGIATLAQRV